MARWREGKMRGLTNFWVWIWIERKNITKSNKLKSLAEYCPMPSHYPKSFSPYNPIVTRIHSISLPTAGFFFLIVHVKSHLWPFVILLNFEGNWNREWRLCLHLVTFDCLSSSCLFPPPSHPVMRAFCTLHYCFRSWHSGHSTLTTDTSLDLDYTVLRLHLGRYLSPSSLTFKYLNHFYNLIGFLWEKVGEDEARNPYIYFLGFFSKLTTISYQSRERSLSLLLSFGNGLWKPARTTLDSSRTVEGICGMCMCPDWG